MTAWPFASCVKSCNLASQCASTSPVSDADNWMCDNMLCAYSGCNSDTECRSAFMDNSYICR